MFQSFKQKLTPLLLFFFLVFQTIIGIFTPVDISFYPPYLEIKETLAASWYDSSWNYRKKITVDHTKVISGLDYDAQTVNFTAGYVLTGGTSGATATISADSDDGATGHLSLHTITGTFQDGETITGANGGSATVNGSLATPGNLPVLLTFDSTDTDFWGHCLAETEIVITSSDGISKLKREVEKFNYASEDLQLWFKAITLSSSVDTEFYIYYGNTSGEEVDDTEVWDNGFVMVQHLNESPADSDPAFKDSAGSNNGTDYGDMTSGDQVAGQIDGSLDFDMTNYVDNGSDENIDDLHTKGGMSISAWINPRTAGVSGTGDILNKAVGATGYWFFSLTNAGLQFRKAGSLSLHVFSVADIVTFNQLQHVVVTWDGSTLGANVHIYLNGEEIVYGWQGTGAGLTSDAAE